MTAPAKITIRRMVVEDLAYVVALDHAAFSDPWPRSVWQEMLEDPNGRVWVAGSELAAASVVSIPTEIIPADIPNLIGVFAVWLILDELHIGTVSVHPHHRQQGIGKKLLETGLRESIQEGARLAHLEVRKSNLHAQALYRCFGFEIVGERKRYYSDNREDAVLMSVYGLGEAYLKWLADGQRNRWRGQNHPVKPQ